MQLHVCTKRPEFPFSFQRQFFSYKYAYKADDKLSFATLAKQMSVLLAGLLRCYCRVDFLLCLVFSGTVLCSRSALCGAECKLSLWGMLSDVFRISIKHEHYLLGVNTLNRLPSCVHTHTHTHTHIYVYLCDGPIRLFAKSWWFASIINAHQCQRAENMY